MVVFNKMFKKYNEIQLTKLKMDLNNRKMKKSATFPGEVQHNNIS